MSTVRTHPAPLLLFLITDTHLTFAFFLSWPASEAAVGAESTRCAAQPHCQQLVSSACRNEGARFRAAGPCYFIYLFFILFSFSVLCCLIFAAPDCPSSLLVLSPQPEHLTSTEFRRLCFDLGLFLDDDNAFNALSLHTAYVKKAKFDLWCDRKRAGRRRTRTRDGVGTLTMG